MRTLHGAREELDGEAARIVAREIARLATQQAQVVLGVVGGRSVGGLYRGLAASDLPWERVHIFLADERLVPLGSDESNFKLVGADLLAPLRASGRIPEGNAHPFRMDAARADAGVAAYTAELARVGGRFDVAILSAGEDGHCASLFPGHASIRDPDPGFILVEASPKPPPRRVSASRHLLERSGLGLIVFYGEEKRAALERLRDPALPVEQCPAKIVAGLAQGYVLSDVG